jgi:hypothetical protein
MSLFLSDFKVEFAKQAELWICWLTAVTPDKIRKI